MNRQRWLLPEGIEELLPEAAARVERLRLLLLGLFDRWGYRLVVPPMVEHLESLLVGAGGDLDLQTFKLVDPGSGRLLGLRADMTPQVARIDAHLLRSDVPQRLCYIGTVLRALPEASGASRSPMQVGAELYGHAGPESDAEVLSLMIQALQLVGIRNLHVDLGHVGIFRGLTRLAGLNADQEGELFGLLQRKDRAGVEALLESWALKAGFREAISALVDLNGGLEVLDRARSELRVGGSVVGEALDHLRRVAEAAGRDLDGVPLFCDLTELRGYRYQTGAVFAAFAPGCGQEIARGGRYDEIGAVFGRARPATGFSLDLRQLLAMDEGEQIETPRGIFAPWRDESDLAARIAELRTQGERVVNGLPGQAGGATELGCDRQLVRRDGRWAVEACE